MSSYMKRVRRDSMAARNEYFSLMPTQYACTECTDRRFYVMLQDDGSIQAYCVQHNHMQLLVNIPELINHVLGTGEQQNVTAENRTDAGNATSDSTEIQGPETTDPADIQPSSHACINDNGDGGTGGSGLHSRDDRETGKQANNPESPKYGDGGSWTFDL